MSLPRVSVTIVFWLMLGLLIPPPLFSQNRQADLKPQIEQTAAAVSELLKQRPLQPKPENQFESMERDSAKESDKPPADDAPINELIAYWRARRYGVFMQGRDKPSDRVSERILEACENRPWLFGQLTNALPETSETFDRIHQILTEAEKEPDSSQGWLQPLRHWLKSTSTHYREELVEDVRHLGENNQMDFSLVHSLARLDWETAKPMVEAMANSADPFRASQAWGIIYGQAVRSGDSTQAELLRQQLKALVANPQSPVPIRQTAFQNLMTTEWSGQEEWYASLFANPLLNGVKLTEPKDPSKNGADVAGSTKSLVSDDGSGFSFLWVPVQQNPTKWLPLVTRLVGGSDRMVHLAAVSCLASYLAAENDGKEFAQQAARALLPWLSDPSWGSQTVRWMYLGGLIKMELPESVPGLIWVLDNDSDATSRAVAAEALIRYRNPAATSALRRALARETNELLRESFIAALAQAGAQNGGFSDEEALSSIEAYIRRTLTPEGLKEIQEVYTNSPVLLVDQNDAAGTGRPPAPEKSLPLPVSIGRVYDEREDLEITESLATRIFARAKALRAAEPGVARRLLFIAERCGAVVTDLNLIERIGDGMIDVEALKLALHLRERMQKRAADELFTLFKKGGHAAGIAAVLLGDEDNYNDLLKGKDAAAQTALLAAARYVRQPLPVELVGKLLNANQTLAAAESYLEMEDSAEARKLIWAKHPGEARILGELPGANASMGEVSVSQWEEKMRMEVLGANGSEEIYAIASIRNPGTHGTHIIRVRKGRAEISLYTSEGRKKTRWMTAAELQELKEFTSREDVENLKAQDSGNYGEFGSDMMRFQYLRLTKDGGRRILLNTGLRRAPKKDATLQEQLAGLFYQLSRTGEFKLRYEMEDRIPGLEVLLADDNRRVFTACQQGAELRVLIEPEKENNPRPVAVTVGWHSFAAGRLGAPTDEPRSCGYQNSFLNTPDWLKEFRRGTGFMPDWRAKSGNTWFSPANIEGEPGLWKLEESKSPVKVVSGTYLNSIATADGKWLVAKKTVQTADKFEMQITRIQVATGREFIVNAPQLANHYPFIFVAAHNKVLLGQGHPQYGRDFTGGTYFLLDAETGAVQPVKGEFRPLQDQTARPLQAAEKPNQFWAAIYDSQKKATMIGRYDARLFTFAPVVELPEIRIGSADLWVDAAAGKAYVTYLGHLLRVPLTK